MAYDTCFLTVVTCVAAVVSLCVVRRLFPHCRDVRCGCRELMWRTTLASSLSCRALWLSWVNVAYDACFLTIVTCVAAVVSFCGVRRLFPLCHDVRCDCRELMWRTTLVSSLSWRALRLSWAYVAYDACFLTVVTCVAAVVSFCGVRRLFPHCRDVRCGCRELMWRTTLVSSLSWRELRLSWAYVACDACFLTVVTSVATVVSLCGVRRLFPHCRDVRCGCRELMWRTTLVSSLSWRALRLSWAYVAYDACFLTVVTCVAVVVSLCGVRRLFPHCRDESCGCRELMWRATLVSSLSWRVLRLSWVYVAYDACFLTVVTCVAAVVSLCGVRRLFPLCRDVRCGCR